jgi:hypothetical protein
VIAPELWPQEVLLWAGRPKQGLVFTVADAFLIPFFLVATAPMLMWVGPVFISVEYWPLPLMGAPFLVLGLYAALGRFPLDAWLRSRAYYGVTTERVILISGLFWRQVTSLDLASLPDPTLRDRRGGAAT